MNFIIQLIMTALTVVYGFLIGWKCREEKYNKDVQRMLYGTSDDEDIEDEDIKAGFIDEDFANYRKVHK